MIRLVAVRLALVLALLEFPGPAAAQLSGGGDLAFRTRHQWRGLSRDDGSVLQPDLFVSYATTPIRFTAGAWSSFRLSPVSRDHGLGFGRDWAGEIDPWLEAAGVIESIDWAVGWTGYYFRDRERAPQALVNTSELYFRLSSLELPVVVPHAAGWIDIDEVTGSYLETGLGVRVPLWAGVIIPVNSLVFDATFGWSLGQELEPSDASSRGYFAERGHTHTDLSVASTFGAFALGAWEAALRVEYHLQLNHDPATRLVNRTRQRDDVDWFGVSLSLNVPRCRPERAICRE